MGGLAGMRESMLPVQKQMFDRGLRVGLRIRHNLRPLGKKQDALHYLQIALEKRETGLLYLVRNSDFNNLHGDSKYQEITAHIDRKLSGKPQL